MRSFLATFLLITMLFNLFAGYTSHVIKVRTVRRQMERLFAALEPGKTKCLSFTTEEFKNLQFDHDGEEFTLNGRKFDITKVEQVNGRVLVHAFEDEVETGLVAEFLQKFKQDNREKGSKSANAWWLKALQTEYIISNTNNIPTYCANGSVYIYPSQVFDITERALTPLCPPPNYMAA